MKYLYLPGDRVYIAARCAVEIRSRPGFEYSVRRAGNYFKMGSEAIIIATINNRQSPDTWCCLLTVDGQFGWLTSGWDFYNDSYQVKDHFEKIT